MNEPNPSEAIAVITRRGGVLRAVDRKGVGKRELVEELDVSRSTIDRSVRELEANGFIERTSSGYRRTLAGELALDEFETFESRVEGVVNSLDVLESLSPDASLDAAVFEDATIVRSDRHLPNRPVMELCDLLDSATSIRSHVVAIFPKQVTTYAERAEAGVEIDLVLAEGAAERLIAEFEEPLQRSLDTDPFHARQISDADEFGVLVVETPDGAEAGVLLLGDGGVRAFVRTDSPTAVAWARNYLQSLEDRSVPLPVDGS